MEYYNSNIQIDKNVIDDVFTEIKTKSNTKMLVFGLGYDSKMWYESTNKNTFFVENKEEYIKLNINNVPLTNIIKYDYKTSCTSSNKLRDDQIQQYIIPEQLAKEGPFDIIIVDGPQGGSHYMAPGRLIPCYWSTLLSKPGSIIYVDDSKRYLENFCIQKYFKNYKMIIFKEREECTKIYI